jgi:hypothetical protein
MVEVAPGHSKACIRGERGLMAAYRRAHKIWEPSLS